MILLLAILAGVAGGLILSYFQNRSWQPPALRHTWLVVIAILPQIFTFYLPATRQAIPNTIAAIGLVLSQMMLLLFCWYNRHLSGIWIMAFGLALNFIAITFNGGFMPISPQTASRLIPEEALLNLRLGERFGYGKDVLLLRESTKFVWLSDQFLLPKWSSYQAAFSIGDIFIALGTFWILLTSGINQRLNKLDKG